MKSDILDNLLANLRRFFNMEDATEAELDQKLEDEINASAGSSASEETDSPEEEPETEAAETETEEASTETEESDEPTVAEQLTARLDALQAENETLQAQIEALKQRHLAAAAEYEQEPAASADPREKYICSTTRRAL